MRGKVCVEGACVCVYLGEDGGNGGVERQLAVGKTPHQTVGGA